jgi:hypothetical protein
LRDERGGRVTELLARPLLNLFWPDLAGFVQPLAGEAAARRAVLDRVPFVSGYSVEIAMLVDLLDLVGLDALAQVDLAAERTDPVPARRRQPLPSLGREIIVSDVGIDERPPADYRRSPTAGVPDGCPVTRTVLMNAGPWLPVPPDGYGGIDNVVAALVPGTAQTGDPSIAGKGQHLAARLARECGFDLVLAGPVGPYRQPADHRAGSGAELAGDVRAGRPIPAAWEEPGGTAVVGALTLGTPAVGLSRGCLPELVEHGRTGWLAKSPDDLAALVQAARRMTRASAVSRPQMVSGFVP